MDKKIPITVLCLGAILVAASLAAQGKGQPGAKRGELRHGPPDFAAGMPRGVVLGSDGLRLEKTARGVFTSRLLETDFTASNLGFLWKVEVPEGTGLVLEVRYKARGGKWSEWRELEGESLADFAETRPELAGYHFDPDPLMDVKGIDIIQFRVTLVGNVRGESPLFREFLLKYADLRPLLDEIEKRRRGGKEQ